MKALILWILASLSSVLAETEVWYDSEGKAVYLSSKEIKPVAKPFVPSWQRPPVNHDKAFRWNVRSRSYRSSASSLSYYSGGYGRHAYPRYRSCGSLPYYRAPHYGHHHQGHHGAKGWRGYYNGNTGRWGLSYRSRGTNVIIRQ